MTVLRELREDDAQAVARLFVEAFGEARRLDAEEIRSWLANEELRPEWLRVLEVDGRVAGYGDIYPHPARVQLDVAAPGHWEPFFDWAEAEAAARGVATHAYFPAGHALAGIVEARGYGLARSSYHMAIELPDEPAPPVLPDGIELRRFRDDDTETLRAALNEAFADDWEWDDVSATSFREFYLRARGFDPELWLLAEDGDELAGFVLAYPERVGDEGFGWIGTLGVRKGWRRRGLGEALLRAAFGELRRRGRRHVGLGVDVENVTGALRLYERVGMHVLRRSDTWIREP
jgi:ribosomal protein S18 acetylase RimI-like enzyme